MISFVLNSEIIHTDMPSGMTVVDFIRYHKHLKGTKIGCRGRRLWGIYGIGNSLSYK